MADKGANEWRTSGGQVADKRWTRSGGVAKANNTRRTSGGHMADKLRRRGQSISRPRENPTVNCLGDKLFGENELHQYRPQIIFQLAKAEICEAKVNTKEIE